MIYEIQQIKFQYPTGKRRILDDVSLTLRPGEIMSILGPNGAGKSTLLCCMADLLRPQEGTILLDGKEITSMSAKEIANVVSFVPQIHTPTFGYTVFHFVLMGRAPKVGMFEKPSQEDMDITMQVLQEMQIQHLADVPYTEISGGERQQATIARARVQEPKVILFDEPTAHLDFGNQLKTLKTIKEMAKQGYAVVLTTHNPDHAILLGGKVAILDREGHLTTGDSEEIVTEERLKTVYQSDLRLMYIEALGRRACIYPNLED